MANYAKRASCRGERRKRRYHHRLLYEQAIAVTDNSPLRQQDVNPFASPEDKAAEPKKLGKDIGVRHAATVAPEGTDAVEDQSEGRNAEGVKNVG